MPSEHIVLPARNIVYIRHFGIVSFADSMAEFEEWCAAPDFNPGHNWLMDFSALDEIDDDPVPMMSFQAGIALRFPARPNPPLFVLFAPGNGPGRAAANLIHKAWDGLDVRLPRLTESESEALDILGQPERTFKSLLAAAPQSTVQTPENGC